MAATTSGDLLPRPPCFRRLSHPVLVLYSQLVTLSFLFSHSVSTVCIFSATFLRRSVSRTTAGEKAESCSPDDRKPLRDERREVGARLAVERGVEKRWIVTA